MSSKNIGNIRWDDVIFYRRNKSYGAYFLRKVYNKHAFYAVVIASCGLVTLTLLPMIINDFKEAPPEVKEEIVVVDYTDLAEPPPIQADAPVPKMAPPPPIRRDDFVPPKVVKDEIRKSYTKVEDVIKIRDDEVDENADSKNSNVTPDLNILVKDNRVEEKKEPEVEEEILTVQGVDQSPEFPGGWAALDRFIKENLRYPENAKAMKLQGKVQLSFIIDKDGSVKEIKVLRGISEDCNEEATRLIKSLPKFKPGKQSGLPVLVRHYVTVFFKLD